MAPSDESDEEKLPRLALAAPKPSPPKRKPARGKAILSGRARAIARTKKHRALSPSEALYIVATEAGFDSVEAYQLDCERQDNIFKAKDQASKNMHMTYVCPLTHGFFLNPVQWGDGHTYEESALKEYMEHQSPPYKSPITKEILLDSEYIPNIALRNALAHAIEAGVLTGGLVDEYKDGLKKREEDAKILAAIKVRAERLDRDALKTLGFVYYHGMYGTKKDAGKAFTTFKKAAELDDSTAMSMYGTMLVDGIGTMPRPSMGMAFVGMAASKGSEHAISLIAHSYQTGTRGFIKNQHEAMRWFSMMASATHKDADTRVRKLCNELFGALIALDQSPRDEEGNDSAGPFTPPYSPRSPEVPTRGLSTPLRF
tara:strand:+ start:14213 stop:15325 length:1113 start_codon:yes stop_codon:yes gene_type:complete